MDDLVSDCQPAGARAFSLFQYVWTWPGTHPVSYSTGTDHSPVCIIKFKNKWSSTSTPPRCLQDMPRNSLTSLIVLYKKKTQAQNHTSGWHWWDRKPVYTKFQKLARDSSRTCWPLKTSSPNALRSSNRSEPPTWGSIRSQVTRILRIFMLYKCVDKMQYWDISIK